MATLELWHNPRCSKSRAALALLEGAGVPFTLRLYLETPPSAERLASVINALGLTAKTFIRRKETTFGALGLAEATEAACLDAMVAHPTLIERPVLCWGAKAALGRPDTTALERLIEAFKEGASAP